MKNTEFKLNAKEHLRGKYGESIKLLLILFLISVAISVIVGLLGLDENKTDLLMSLFSFILNGLLMFGYNSFFLKISRNEEVTYKELFSKTSMFLPYIAISLLVSIFTALWSVLFVIPGIIASISYSMVYFVALDNPEMDALAVISKSKEIMQGHKMRYFLLVLYFLGFAILGAFTFGILYLWLIPYMQVTFANFYNEIKG